MKIKILSLVFITIFAISSTTMAQQRDRQERAPQQREMMAERPERDRGNFEKFFTEEQQEKIKELRLESTKQTQPLRNELNELRAKQRTLTTAEKADLNAINKNIDQMADVQAKIQKIRAKQQQEIRSMLNDEQRIKFDEMRSRPDRGFDREPTNRDRFKRGA
ncbi:periplasmic heavy metal sensor [Draconibacterium sp. IB214405]|uniref:Spy/CpxP family protein refolding chaperone n=1 Tax=Draconibacterium sp. IB214405 TaxID=3097352 RepID=UPI002A0F1AD4|nr:periplasmic heavy metal sensor [Draconibacterium sp. IB214405]MDX8338084.1 periplasmic heavy metal sensor [Draconibacterium sp. IB214405]